ncbi:MAG TPA: hypothetical protein VJ742_12780 [Nitrososphaera sp.]|nr:hypothetical protein [Nitrososphaera sp.]
MPECIYVALLDDDDATEVEVIVPRDHLGFPEIDDEEWYDLFIEAFRKQYPSYAHEDIYPDDYWPKGYNDGVPKPTYEDLTTGFEAIMDLVRPHMNVGKIGPNFEVLEAGVPQSGQAMYDLASAIFNVCAKTLNPSGYDGT